MIDAENIMVPIKECKLEESVINDVEEYLGEDVKNLYHFPGRPYVPYCYFEDFIWLHLFKIDVEDMKKMRMKDFIFQRRSQNEKWLKEKKFKLLLSYTETIIKIDMYIKYFELIPDEDKYDIFRFVYTKSEYNFGRFDSSFLEEVFSFRKLSEKWRANMEYLNQFVDSEGMVKIYRGQGDKSTSIENALSWTLQKNVAIFFANRFDSKGICWEAKVHLSDIWDYLPQRNEEEVLVDFDTLIDVRTI